MKKVFISTSSFAKDDSRPMDLLKEAELEVYTNPYSRKLTEDEISDLLFGTDFLIAGTEPLTQRVLESAEKLKIISRCGVGMDNVDLKAAAQLGIMVFNTPYGPTLSVAELTIGLMLDLLRRVTMMDREIRAGTWKKRMGNLLRGKRVGIIGFGKIGQKVAELLIPFGAEIAYCDVCTCQCSIEASPKQIDEILTWADIVTLHCSAKGGGGLLLGKEELARMRQGSWLVNASRGGLVDEEALYFALKEGHLSGAALDVFDKEPYAGPFTKMDNVILTPHIGSYAKEGRIEMEIQATKNLLDAIKNT